MILISKSDKRQTVRRGPFTSRFLPLGKALMDSDDHGIAQIGQLKHAALEGGTLVPMHLHQNEEILSYIRSATMHHKDSDGNDIPIHNKHLMLMNAGSGIHHEEGVRERDETVEMPQIFIRQKTDGLTGFMYQFSVRVTIKANSGETVKKGDFIIKDERLTVNSNEDSDIVFFDWMKPHPTAETTYIQSER